jgi:L-ectoine synthase
VIVRTTSEVEGTEFDVSGPAWQSIRLLTRNDGCGFSLHDTYVDAGAELTLWYKHHIEACLCVEGSGSIEDLSSGRVFEIAPGTLYALDDHDRHLVRARTRLRLICVFNPALTGTERHDADGSYLPSEGAGR